MRVHSMPQVLTSTMKPECATIAAPGITILQFRYEYFKPTLHIS